MNSKKIGLTAILFSFLLSIGAIAQSAKLAGAPKAPERFNISAQPLSSALRQYADQTGEQVVFFSEIGKDQKSSEVNGNFTHDEALNTLLRNTGLTYERMSPNTVAITNLKTRAARLSRTVLRLAENENGQSVEQANSPAAEAAQNAAADANRTTERDQGLLESVTVTGTRVTREGFVAPTPTTVLNASDLQVSGRTNIGEILADLPNARGTITPVTTGRTTTQAGESNADLRGLGISRTLVLIDGRRPVSTDGTAFDLNSIPMGLVQRVEMVTGGASAAYGSDAVSGVVNIIMADKLDGVRLAAQYGETMGGDGGEYKIDFSYGSSFNNNRAHVLLGGTYNDAKAIVPQISNPAFGFNFLANPNFTPTNGQPQQLLAPNVVFASSSLGGLITGCGPPPPVPGTCLTSGLLGLTFEPNGTSRPFVFGQPRGPFLMSGGDVQAVSAAYFSPLKAPTSRNNLYARTAFDLTDNLKLTVDAYYTHSESDAGLIPDGNGSFPGFPLIINVNNAFLPANIRTRMVNAGITNIQMGRVNADMGLINNLLTNNNAQGTVGLQGKFAATWSWDAFYSYGEAHQSDKVSNQQILPLYMDSVDSVIGPGGQPVCRSALTNPNSLCVPVNLFGLGAVSQAALSYFMGTAQMDTVIEQKEAAATLRGEPFATWAGSVSVALGGEWRRQSLSVTADPLSKQGLFQGINFADLAGANTVTEGFLEAVVPLARNLPLMQALDFDGAVRRSHYSGSGNFNSWKLSASDDLVQGLRLRVTRSQDIRAPNLNELFTPPFQNLTTVLDPATNTQFNIQTLTGGNPNLDAEKSTSTTIGLVYRPSWVHNLDLSVDYYRIEINGAISVIPAQDIVTRCANGKTEFCSLITRNNAGDITFVSATFINLQTFTEKGVDFEAVHSLNLSSLTPSLRGQLRTRALVTYVGDYTQFDGITFVDNAGSVGGGGLPHWRGLLDERYELGSMGFNLRARYVGGGARSRLVSIDVNHVPSELYFDFGMEFRSSESKGGVSLFANVTNLFDRKAPPAPAPALHEVIGRGFNLGVRMSF